LLAKRPLPFEENALLESSISSIGDQDPATLKNLTENKRKGNFELPLKKQGLSLLKRRRQSSAVPFVFFYYFCRQLGNKV
jgi:hypothetical protein